VAPLRAEHLDLRSQPATLLVADGKGGKQRVVPLGPGLVEALRGCALPRRGWLFPGQTRQRVPTGDHVSASQVSHLCSKYLREVIGSESSYHALRHRFGTDAWAASLDLRLVGDLLGHANPRTTAGYAALVPGRAAAVTAELSARLLPANSPM
jgi:integrase/recombinase XerC